MYIYTTLPPLVVVALCCRDNALMTPEHNGIYNSYPTVARFKTVIKMYFYRNGLGRRPISKYISKSTVRYSLLFPGHQEGKNISSLDEYFMLSQVSILPLYSGHVRCTLAGVLNAYKRCVSACRADAPPRRGVAVRSTSEQTTKSVLYSSISDIFFFVYPINSDVIK